MQDGSQSKKETYGYRERDELQRQDFEERLKTKLLDQRVDVDEAGIIGHKLKLCAICQFSLTNHYWKLKALLILALGLGELERAHDLVSARQFVNAKKTSN